MNDNDDEDTIRMAVMGKQLTPNISIHARIVSTSNSRNDTLDGLSTLLTIERAILDGLTKDHHFRNVREVSDKTGEPVHNFSTMPAPGNPVLDVPILVVSKQAVGAMAKINHVIEAPRVYPRERLVDTIRYIDDGLTDEDCIYAK